jgi:hypothetical protein
MAGDVRGRRPNNRNRCDAMQETEQSGRWRVMQTVACKKKAPGMIADSSRGARMTTIREALRSGVIRIILNKPRFPLPHRTSSNASHGLPQFLASAPAWPARRVAGRGIEPARSHSAGTSGSQSSRAGGGRLRRFTSIKLRAGQGLHSALHVGWARPAGYLGFET